MGHRHHEKSRRPSPSRGRSWSCPSRCFTSQCTNITVAGLVLGFFLFGFHGYRLTQGETLSYVTVSGNRFESDCRPFRFVGFNTHDLVQAASMTPSDYLMKDHKSGRARVRDLMREASAAGLNVLRTWVHTNDDHFPFQKKPGAYEESTLRSLDYILDEARRHGIHVILSLIDNWKYYNGVDQYVDWSSTAPERIRQRPKDKDGDPSPLDFEDEEIKRYETERHALFFSDPQCKKIYKKHVQTIVNRKNRLNGALYKNDPTILAWDLINEPRCEEWAVPECADHLQNWLEEMSLFLRTEDPNHLITIGSEGFFGKDSEHASHNPHDWGGVLGQDWTRNHAIKNVDFATIHVWPNNWNRTDVAFQTDWLDAHIEAAAKIGKPLLLEEFGKKIEFDDKNIVESVRDPVYEQIYSAVEESMKQGKNLHGSLFWRWNMPLYDHKARGEYGVRPSDSTFKQIKRHAMFVHSLMNAVPPGESCLRGCWIPEGSSRKTCVQKPEVCQSLRMVDIEPSDGNAFNQTVQLSGKLVKILDVKTYPTKKACCRAGLGGFENGCSFSVYQ